MKRMKIAWLFFLVTLLITISVVTAWGQPFGQPEMEDSEPTLASCQAWIQENSTLDYPDHGCEEYGDVLNSLADDGAGAMPLGDSKFYIARFPDNWDSLSDRKLIVTLHGSGGCT